MDISGINASTSPVEIRHPGTQELLGLTVHLRPMSDPKVKAVQRRFTNEALRKRNMKITAEQAEASRTDVLVSAVDSWEWAGDASFNGEQPECTAENIRKLLKVDWLRDQLDEALGDEAAFFGG